MNSEVEEDPDQGFQPNKELGHRLRSMVMRCLLSLNWGIENAKASAAFNTTKDNINRGLNLE